LQNRNAISEGELLNALQSTFERETAYRSPCVTAAQRDYLRLS